MLPEVASTSGDVTIEFWINPSKIQTYNGDAFIIGNNINGLGTWAISLYAPTNKIGVWLDSFSSLRTLSNETVNRESWNHIALVKNAGIIRLYINGIQESATITQSANFGQGSNVYIGQYHAGGQPYTGYVSDVRVVNGTAIYTSNFAPPTENLTAIANTSLLTCQGSSIVDAITNAHTITVTGNAASVNADPYGTERVMTFDGTGDYLVVSSSSTDYGYGTGDFTIELWVYFNYISTQTVLSNLTTASSTNPHLYLFNTDSTIKYYTASADRITSSALSANTWYHVALSRASGSTKLFIDGTQSGSTYTDSNNYGTTAPFVVGTYYNGGSLHTASPLSGYVQDVRVTKGLARYTSNFTPPTALLKG